MSPQLLKVVDRASKNPNARLYSLARLIDPDALKRAFARIRKDAAVGVDGITKEQYEQNLEQNIQGLHERLKSGRYRHQPIRRVHIPKAPGKTRPIGISSIEDKIVQGALTEVLQAIYEQDFMDGSYGFRPRRSAHDALRAVDAMAFHEGIKWILEADIQAYFDSLDRSKLMQMLRIRVADESLMRLIGKCLNVGVLEPPIHSTSPIKITKWCDAALAKVPLLGHILRVIRRESFSHEVSLPYRYGGNLHRNPPLPRHLLCSGQPDPRRRHSRPRQARRPPHRPAPPQGCLGPSSRC